MRGGQITQPVSASDAWQDRTETRDFDPLAQLGGTMVQSPLAVVPPFRKLRVLDLFSGIGGFSLGLERTGGFETVAFCEINPFCRRVLERHWPWVRQYCDVEALTAAQLATDNIQVDVISGGFPCQDVSSAGRRAGIEGSRTGLWKHVVRLAGELRPRLILLENVTGLLDGERGAWFGRVLGDLAAVGYDAEWHCIPASAIGGLHERDRVWITAYPNADSLRLQGVWGAAAGTWPEEQFTRLVQVALRDAVPTRSGGGVHDGVSDRAHRLHALGNAVVPQIPELIGRAILASIQADTLDGFDSYHGCHNGD